MKNWFEVKVKYNKTGDNGKDKSVTETYLFDAVSFTEAEKRIFEELLAYEALQLENVKRFSEGMKIEAIKKTNIIELFPYDIGDYWFKIAAEMITLDKAERKEKKVKLHYLVLADDIQQALTRFSKSLDGSVVPYVVTLITLTSIVEVYPYKFKENENS